VTKHVMPPTCRRREDNVVGTAMEAAARPASGPAGRGTGRRGGGPDGEAELEDQR
jgi:hypothetical protein